MARSSAVAALALLAAAEAQAPIPLIGAHYFAGWYNCSGYSQSECYSHFKGFTPTGTPVDNFFPAYPSRTPLLG